MDWTKVVLATLSGAVGGVIATAIAGSARKRPAVFAAVMGLSFAILNAASNSLPTTLKGAIDGAIANIEKTRGVSNVSDTRLPWQVDGREGAIVALKLEGKEDEVEGRALFLTQASELWQVILLYRPTQVAGEQLAAKIIGSAKFESTIGNSASTGEAR